MKQNFPLTRRAMMTSAAALGCCGLSWSQTAWPQKSVRLIVPYPAGGAADQTGRLLGHALGERLKTSFVIENRAGGNGTIGAAAAAQSAPDGYTVLLDSTGFVVNPHLIPKLAFDPVKDFSPVSLVMLVPMLLVVPVNSRFKSVDEVVQAARAKPGDLTFASAGNGSAQHLAGELFKQGHRISMTHIPYRGGAPALTDLVAGQVDLMFSAISASSPFVQAGKLRALAVTSDKRSALYPDLPTVAERGLSGFTAQEWNGIWLPRGVPASIVEKLEIEIREVLKQPEVQSKFQASGAVPVGSSRAEFAQFLKSESAKFAAVIKTAGIRLD